MGGVHTYKECIPLFIFMIIYRATNSANGKVYIGQTTRNLYDRKSAHKMRSMTGTSPFYTAIREYGWDKFDWRVIDRADTIDELLDKEEFWISYYKMDGRAYNEMTGGRHSKHSNTSKKIMRRIQSGKGNGFYGKTHTPEARKRISNNHARHMLGKEHTPEAIEKIRAARARQVITKEHRKNMCIAQRARRDRERVLAIAS